MLQKNAPTLASESTTSDCRELQPFDSEAEFQDELCDVLRRDYGVEIDSKDLDEVTSNLNHFLETFLQ